MHFVISRTIIIARFMLLLVSINVVDKQCVNLQCNIFFTGAIPKPVNMDDILIVSLKCSEAATLWVEYFASYFQQISKQANRKPFK